MHNLVYNMEDTTSILSLLDGWELQSTNPKNTEHNKLNPFMSDVEITTSNKKVKSKEVETFFNNSVINALTYLSRLNVDDFSSTELSFFRTAVHYWTASDLWNKYNIRVNNEDMEDTYTQSYGGLLYKKGKAILDKFNNDNFTIIRNESERLNTHWII